MCKINLRVNQIVLSAPKTHCVYCLILIFFHLLTQMDITWLSSYREQKEAKLWMPDLRHCTHGQKPKKQTNEKMTLMITWAMTSSWHQRKAERDEEEAMPLSSYKSRVKRKRNGSKRKWSIAGRWLRLRWSGKIYFNSSCKCSHSKCKRCRLWC